MGTLPQDLSLPTSRNRPYSPTMSTVPTSWRHRDKVTSTHWVWVEHSPTREAGWYTQQAGTWLRYQPDDSVQTQSQVRRHEGAARHYYTDYYDPLTGCTWTWFDTTNHYDEGWWAYSREGWTRYSPGPPRPSGVPHGGLAHAPPPPRATSQPVVNLQVHMHPLPRMHAHAAQPMHHMALFGETGGSRLNFNPEGYQTQRDHLPMWLDVPVLPTWDMAHARAAMTAYTGYQVDSTVLQERQAVGQTQEQGSTPESFTCTTNEQPALE